LDELRGEARNRGLESIGQRGDIVDEIQKYNIDETTRYRSLLLYWVKRDVFKAEAKSSVDFLKDEVVLLYETDGAHWSNPNK
jgi:hypothetical protein